MAAEDRGASSAAAPWKVAAWTLPTPAAVTRLGCSNVMESKVPRLQFEVQKDHNIVRLGIWSLYILPKIISHTGCKLKCKRYTHNNKQSFANSPNCGP